MYIVSELLIVHSVCMFGSLCLASKVITRLKVSGLKIFFPLGCMPADLHRNYHANAHLICLVPSILNLIP